MIREYEKTDWPEVCRVFGLSKPHELVTGGIAASFVPLAKDESRTGEDGSGLASVAPVQCRNGR
jgi:hypothetical protein